MKNCEIIAVANGWILRVRPEDYSRGDYIGTEGNLVFTEAVELASYIEANLEPLNKEQVVKPSVGYLHANGSMADTPELFSVVVDRMTKLKDASTLDAMFGTTSLINQEEYKADYKTKQPYEE